MNNNLIERFARFVREEDLWRPGRSWLVALSGGVDSIVLAHLCKAVGIPCVLAHCNFRLRADESERDERFVRSFAEAQGLPLVVRKFDTKAAGPNVQVAARELRYAWFRELLVPPVERIATAHHLDDNVETMLMNFVKGTGIAGLRGILPSRDGIVRPLLFARKAELIEYASANGLGYVQDSSNESDEYNRNFFRLHVIPLLEERIPGVMDNLADNLGRFRETETLFRKALERERARLLEPHDEGFRISVAKLRKSDPLCTIIYELLRPYGFTAAQVGEVKALLDSRTGRWVASATHRVLRDRAWVILTGLPEVTARVARVVEGVGAIIEFGEGRLAVEPVRAAVFPRDPDPQVAVIDARAVHFPLVVRPWKTGDYFYPLGMRKKKKLARFFIDRKLSLAEKERIWVVESEGRILWVIGQRIDERVKITDSTTAIVRLTWTPIVK